MNFKSQSKYKLKVFQIDIGIELDIGIVIGIDIAVF
jgi:hypothetical protein